MRKRILISAVGGVVGLVIAPPVQDFVGLAARTAFIVCMAAGLVVGYTVSAAVDAFSATAPESSENPE